MESGFTSLVPNIFSVLTMSMTLTNASSIDSLAISTLSVSVCGSQIVWDCVYVCVYAWMEWTWSVYVCMSTFQLIPYYVDVYTHAHIHARMHTYTHTPHRHHHPPPFEDCEPTEQKMEIVDSLSSQWLVLSLSLLHSNLPFCPISSPPPPPLSYTPTSLSVLSLPPTPT